MTRVLLVDDDTSLVTLLGDYLVRQGYEVLSATDGAKALELIGNDTPDLILLDVRMEGLDGWQTLERIRGMSRVPVIMLTALGDEPDVLKGFALGADDYVAKPFSFAQLVARVNAVLQRRRREDAGDRLQGGDLVVDIGAHRVQRGGKPIFLTPTEFKLLAALMEQPGRVLTARQLVTRVWGPEYANDTAYIRRYIWHLRQKIEPDPEKPKYVHNERGVGYCFSVQS